MLNYPIALIFNLVSAYDFASLVEVKVSFELNTFRYLNISAYAYLAPMLLSRAVNGIGVNSSSAERFSIYLFKISFWSSLSIGI